MDTFTKLTLDSKELFDRYLKPFNSRASELSFTNLYMWRQKYDFHYAVLGEYLWVLNRTPSDTWYFSPPIGDYNGNLKASIDALRELLDGLQRPLVIKKAEKSVMEAIQGLYPEDMSATETRNDFDYLYDYEALRTLKGNVYHKKRNHVNKFLKTCPDWRYEVLDTTNAAEAALCLDRWCDFHACAADPDLAHERRAILDLLENMEALDFNGGLIRLDGTVEAFTLAERLSADTTVIHIEKAEVSIDGLYAAINKLYLEHCPSPTAFVNREQDLGLPGIKKAKESYHPVGFVEKYTLRFASPAN